MKRLFKAIPLAWWLVACSPFASLRADTVYLKNGAWIDGRARVRGEIVEIEIGKLGKVEIKLEEVYEIERNSRTGEYSERSGSETAENQTSAPAPQASAGTGEDVGAKEKSPREAGSGSQTAEDASSKAEEDTSSVDPELKAKIEQLVRDLQRQKAQFRVRAERQLKSIGAPVVPFITPLRKNPSELTRIAAFRILEEVGDERAIEACLDGLSDSNEYVREYANKALKRITGQDFGFVAVAAPRRRELAEAKWRAWWEGEKKNRAESSSR